MLLVVMLALRLLMGDAGAPPDAPLPPAGARITLACNVGPVSRPFGGTAWLVYSCHNDTSLTLMSTTAADGPFVIMMVIRGEEVRVNAMGVRPTAATDAAAAELRALTPDQVRALIAETEAASAPGASATDGK